MKIRSVALSSIRTALSCLELDSDWGCVALQLDEEDVVGAQFGMFAYRADSGKEFVLFDIPFPDEFKVDRGFCNQFCLSTAESEPVSLIVEFSATQDWLDRAAELIVGFAFKAFSPEIRQKLKVLSYTVEPKRNLGIPEGLVLPERELKIALEAS